MQVIEAAIEWETINVMATLDHLYCYIMSGDMGLMRNIEDTAKCFNMYLDSVIARLAKLDGEKEAAE